MEIKLAVLADYSNVSKEGKLNILGIFDTIYTKSFPAIHQSMQLVMRFEIPRAELDTTKELAVKLIDEDGNKLLEVGGPFSINYSAIPQDKISIEVNQVLTLNNLVFPKAGNYEFSILIGGETRRSVPLKVVQIP